jgi:glycosyltransferase involved in cell wall biosynthesis
MRGNRIRVCFPFIGDELGGSHVSALKLIKNLDPQVVEPVVVLHHPEGPVADLLRGEGIPFRPAPPIAAAVAAKHRGRIGGAVGALRTALDLAGAGRRLLQDEAIDIVHTNDGRMHVFWALPARLAGVAQFWHHRGDPDARALNLIAPLVASRIVTVSAFSRPSRPVVDVSKRLHVVRSPFDRLPPPTDRAAAHARLAADLGVPPETRFLGYFGLLIDRKRPIKFVEAVAAVARRHGAAPVMGLLFGVPGLESPDLGDQAMARAAELGIADRIRLMGYRSPVEPYMAAMDCLLVTAVREPFGRTLVEAMFLGTPIVATADGGNIEAVRDGVNGLLVPPDAPEAFAEPVDRILSDPAFAARLTDEARREADRQFSVEGHVERVTDLYREIMAERRAPGPPPRAALRSSP